MKCSDAQPSHVVYECWRVWRLEWCTDSTEYRHTLEVDAEANEAADAEPDVEADAEADVGSRI
jgi:hypothetical protein